MSSRPNLLMVCYFHPPAATGVRRSLSLIRWLPVHGWRPLVLTVRDVHGQGNDPSPLLDEPVRAAPVVRTGSLDPYRIMQVLRPLRGGAPAIASALGSKSSTSSQKWMTILRRHFFWPDDRCGWIPYAAMRGIRLVRRNRLRAIYSSSYPQSSHIVAGIIHLATGVTWLADFRDGWTQNPAFFERGNPIMEWAQRAGERWVARNASQVVTVSPPITRHLQRLRPRQLTRCHTVFNGFEDGELESAAGIETTTPLHPGFKTMLYTGTFFGRRRPDLFLAALSMVLKEEPKLASQFRVRLRCALSAREQALADRLAPVVEVLPPIPFRECQEEQRRAGAFLLVLERGPGSDIMVSQKVFEYLSARRPIFALVPEGAAADLLRQTGGAHLCLAGESREAARELRTFIGQLVDGTGPTAAPGKLESFTRRSQAARIAKLLDAM